MNKQDNYKLLIRNLRKKYNEKLTIIERYKNLENEFDFVLVEGSDFTEEGSVFEIDFNGSIAKNLGIPVLLVVKDSFETVPELVNNVIAEVNSFLEKDVNIIGVIVNRCEKEQDKKADVQMKG